MKDVIIIPSDGTLQVGDKTAYEGKTYEGKEVFTQGEDAANSAYTYFVHINKGVMGMEEV